MTTSSRIIRATVVLSFVLAGACSRGTNGGASAGETTGAAPAATGGAPALPAAPDTALVASLERGPCRGMCPVYRVDVYGDGRVRFDGKQHVKSTGAHTTTVTPDVLRSLVQAFTESPFAGDDTAFVYGSARCGQYYTDLPVATLSARVGAGLKTVQHDPGCQGAPAYLKTLAARIDSAAGTARWITGDAR